MNLYHLPVIGKRLGHARRMEGRATVCRLVASGYHPTWVLRYAEGHWDACRKHARVRDMYEAQGMVEMARELCKRAEWRRRRW